MYGAGGKRVKLVGLGAISECSQSAVSRGSSSAGIGPLCLVFVSLSYIPANILLVAISVISVPLGSHTRVQVQGETSPAPQGV